MGLLEAIAVSAWGWTVAAVVLVVVFFCGMGIGSVLAHSRLQADGEHLAAIREWRETFPEEGQAHEPGPGRHERLAWEPPVDPGPELAAAPVDTPPVDGPAPAFEWPESALPGLRDWTETELQSASAGEDLVTPPAAVAAWPPDSDVIVADLTLSTSPKFPMLDRRRWAELKALSPEQRLDVLIIASGYAADAIDRALRELRTLR